MYVIAADSRQEGFIPHSYCTPYNTPLGELAMNNVKKKLPREQRCSNAAGPEVEVDINTDARAGGKFCLLLPSVFFIISTNDLFMSIIAVEHN